MGAQNTLEIIIKAKSGQAITEIKKLDQAIGPRGALGKSVDGLKAKFSGFISYLTSPQGLMMVGTVAGGIVTALGAAATAAKKYADEFMNYTFQVKDFGRIIGATPEEASKLIQVADDVRLSVESMTTAMRSAITKGYAPSIEGLGRMSDAYLAIQDPIERSRYLVETFGRSGLEMAKLMELGSKKIEAMGKEVEGTARLMTTQGIKAADDYYQALDKLGEVSEDFTLILGAQATPVLTKFANSLADIADGQMKVTILANLLNDALKRGLITEEQQAILIQGLRDGTYEWAEATDILTKSIHKNIAEVTRGSPMYQSFMDQVKLMQEQAANTDLTIPAPEIEQPDPVEVLLQFKIPDITQQLSTMITNINWQEAGGAAVEQWGAGFSQLLPGMSKEIREALAPDIAAIALAVDVEIGRKTPAEAAAELQAAFPSLTGEEALLKVQAAVDADPDSPQEIMAFIQEKLNAMSATVPVTDIELPLLKGDISAIESNTGKIADNWTKIKDKRVKLTIDIVTNGTIPPGYTVPQPDQEPAAGISNFIVPPGYPADRYLFGVTSGERVTVENRAQQAKNTPAVNQYITLQAVEPMDFRALARQVAKELAGAGAR